MGLIVGIGIMIPVTALGSTHISAVLQPSVNVKVDGQLVELQSEPLNYNGRIYLQLREIGEKVMGMDVDWEGDTSTAVLTTPEQTSSTLPEPQTLEGDLVEETKTIDFSELGYDEFYIVDDSLEYYEIAQLIERLNGRIAQHETVLESSKNPNSGYSSLPELVESYKTELDKMKNVLPEWQELLDIKIQESGIYDDITYPEPIDSTDAE